MNTIVLFMIVKNEEKTIRRCLESTLSFVNYYLITDTGSTDQTVSIIDEFLVKYNKGGTVFHDEWENFGKNRTKSMKNALNWLKINDISMENVYLLTIDADMNMIINKPETINLKADIIYLVQKNGSLSYSNIRMFKANKCIEHDIECKGSTHEYWHCENTTEEFVSSETLWIDDLGDGGSKNDKFERDIYLLNKDLEIDPENKRSWFYLGRSYEDVGNLKKAIDCYLKRIELGGWIEEIYISYKQLGHIYIKMEEYNKAIDVWLKAYEILPQRIETLFYLALYYQAINDLEKSLFLLLQCYSTPYPNPKECVLFIEESIYDYKILEELSILCFYFEEYKELGREICLRLLFTNYEKYKDKGILYIKESTKWNYLFYLKPINFLCQYTLSLSLSLPLFSSTSASLIPKNSESIKNVKGIVRYVNYYIDNEGKYKGKGKDENEIITKNIWYDSVTQEYKECHILPLPKRNHHIKGMEDIRLTYDHSNQCYYGLGVSWEYGEVETPSVCFLTFNENGDIATIKQIPYETHICQKNWTFYMNTQNNKPTIIYSHHPLTILEYNISDNSVTVVKSAYSGYDLSSIRGSSNPICLDSHYLLLVHQTIFDRENKRRYVHLFLKYSLDWMLTGISEGFFFKNLFIEFSLSMYNKENVICIPYSVRDNTTEIVEIDYNCIKWLDLDKFSKI